STPAGGSVHSTLDCLSVDPVVLPSPGLHSLKLLLDPMRLTPGALLEGEIVIQCPGEVTRIRVTGMVEENEIRPVQTSIVALAEPWDLVYRLAGHEGGVRAVAFWPQQEVLISGPVDRTIRWWDLSS